MAETATERFEREWGALEDAEGSDDGRFARGWTSKPADRKDREFVDDEA